MNPAPSFPDPLTTPEDIEKLRTNVDVKKELGYVFDAITLTRKGLNGEVPLIGFTGAPWTLFMYMVEGGGSKTMQKSKSWLFKWPKESKEVLDRITDVCIDYLVEQVRAGAQVRCFTFSISKKLQTHNSRVQYHRPSKYSIQTQVTSPHTTSTNSPTLTSPVSPPPSAPVSPPSPSLTSPSSSSPKAQITP